MELAREQGYQVVPQVILATDWHQMELAREQDYHVESQLTHSTD